MICKDKSEYNWGSKLITFNYQLTETDILYVHSLLKTFQFQWNYYHAKAAE